MVSKVKSQYGKESTTRKYWFILNEVFSRLLIGDETIDIANMVIRGELVYADVVIRRKEHELSLPGFVIPCSLFEDCTASISSRSAFDAGMYTNLFGKTLNRLLEHLRTSEDETHHRYIEKLIADLKFQHECMLKATEDTEHVRSSYYPPVWYAEKLTMLVSESIKYLDNLDSNWGSVG